MHYDIHLGLYHLDILKLWLYYVRDGYCSQIYGKYYEQL